MPESNLDRYVSNYGQRLQSLLQPTPVTDTSSVLGRPATQAQAAQVDPVARAPGAPAPASPASMLETPQEKPTSVRDLYKTQGDAEQQKQAADLEDALKRGGSSIDKAYDELVKQMGTRPDEGLTKEDKAMLLIEFGLNLMANSSGDAYGEDLGGAIGATGLNSMDSYQRTKGARTRDWDARRSALEQGRVKDKLNQSMLATKEEVQADAALPREFANQRPDRDQFAGGDGYMYETVDGKARRMVDENGKPIRAAQKDVTGSGGSEKVFEFDHRRKAYMESRGYDWEGNPLQGDLPKLSGSQLRKLRREATEFAGDTKNASMSDEEITQQAIRSVEDQMRFSQDLYRDYTPAQYEAERKRLVAERIKEIKAGRTDAEDGGSALEVPEAPEVPPYLRNPAFKGDKTPPASALVAGKARRIKGFEGRWTLVNGKPTRVD